MKWTLLTLWVLCILFFASLTIPAQAQDYDLFGPEAGYGQIIDLRAGDLESAPYHARIRAGDGSCGSGTLFYDDGRYAAVLTAAHVFTESQEGTRVEFPNGAEYPGKIVALDKNWDVAIVAIVSPGIPPAESAERFEGREFRAGGFGGDEGIFRILSGRYLRRTAGPYASAVMAGAVRPGDSGGGIFDHRGRLAGHIWGCNFETEQTYFRPLADVRAIVRRGLERIQKFPDPHASATAPRRRLVVVGSTSCPPCERLKPILAGLNAIGYDTTYTLHSDYAGTEAITSYPTLLFFEDQHLTARLEGFQDRETILAHLGGSE